LYESLKYFQDTDLRPKVFRFRTSLPSSLLKDLVLTFQRAARASLEFPAAGVSRSQSSSQHLKYFQWFRSQKSKKKKDRVRKKITKLLKIVGRPNFNSCRKSRHPQPLGP
jgi:hypothetical protein